MQSYQKPFMVFYFIFLVAACSQKSFISSDVPAGGPKPPWLIQRPIDPNYYLGIGSASKTVHGAEALKSAQDLALADIASQISVSVSSEIVTTLIEKGAMTEEEYLATARSRTAADLEGHELVDTWQDEAYHYAYFRLSKAQYAAIQARKRAEALALSTDLFASSSDASGGADFSQELRSLIQAFEPLIPYLEEALETDLAGTRVILSNKINASISQVLTDIKLEPNTGELSAKLGKPIRDKLSIQARTNSGSPINGLPLRIYFQNAPEERVVEVITDEKGVAEVPVLRLGSGDKLQILIIEVNPEGLIPEATSPITTGLVKSAGRINTRINIDVTNPTIFLAAKEVFNGQSLSQKRIEPKLKNHLIEKGFHFVDYGSQADWYMELNATATPGTQYSGMYTVFADVSLSLRDRESGKEIYKNSLSRVKGIDLNYPAAANKALSNAADELTKHMLPKIMASLK